MLASWPNGIIDPHIHQWDPLTTERVQSREARLVRALPRIPRFVGEIAPKVDREFIGHPHHILKPYLPDTYRDDANRCPSRRSSTSRSNGLRRNPWIQWGRPSGSPACRSGATVRLTWARSW